ncbi:Tetratricopeptide repeat protein [Rubripirellula lacrimiformis]|uniref:Tetratricopeptide repeat protein n=1 Tax=Rubripirellula lacrimiformis TaxID=1930273 RepID=A0A517NKX1_9BACT|nr:hypothetical protein [Rubripirellula lacrimiformis]QDT07776.1 Tetratricopeptide repeat protein [Rubripirellula lacrimiformis]
MTAWFAGERPPVDRDEFIAYTADQLQSYREARDLLLRSIELNPYFPDAYILLGNAYQEIDNDMSSMVRHYDQAIHLDPDNDEFRNARMSHYLSIGDLDRCKPMNTPASKRMPSHATHGQIGRRIERSFGVVDSK